MMESRGQRKRLMIVQCIGLCLVLTIAVGVIGVCMLSCNTKEPHKDPVDTPLVSTETIEPSNDVISSPEEQDVPVQGFEDPNNSVYPYSLMSIDWEAELYEQGWKYYEIPSSYKMAGGMFPEVAQVYLWYICEEAGVDYYMVLAMIERESGYKYDAVGDKGNSKGLLQIQEKWHKDRMQAVGATSLYNPYDNMRVAVSFLKEIQDRYLDSSGEHCVLMVYNMGATGAKRLWDQGIYSTAYTKQILQRAHEIKQELQDQ